MIKLAKFYFVLVWAFFIFKLMTAPLLAEAEYGFAWYDKIIHCLLFGVMAWLLYIFIQVLINKKAIYALFFAVLLAAVYAVLIEIVQVNIPGRYYSIADISAGALGSVIAAVIIYARSAGKKT